MQPQETLRALEEAAPPRVREDLPPPRLIKEPAAPRIIEEPPAPRIIEDPAPQRVSEVAVLPSVVNDAAPPLSPAAPDIPKVEANSNESAPPAQSPARPFLRHGSLKAILPFVAVFMLASLVVVVVRIGARRTSGQAGSGSHPPAKPAVSASAQTGLGLAVRQEAGQLHLTWSRDSFAAKAATSGTLQIQDGASSVSIRLAVSDLTEGSIVYTPHSQDVTFQLRLGESPGPSAEETIRVIGAGQAAVT